MAEECPNPLLLRWIKEWLDEAREHNSKGVTVYKKAYDSMKACPLRFEHPSQAQALHGVGPKLCDRLTEKLKAFCAQNGLPTPKRARGNAKRKSIDTVPPDSNPDPDLSAPPKRTRKTKAYVPALRSGAYAIIMALASIGEDASQGLTKKTIIELAQPYCDASFIAPTDPSKYFTAWNSVKTLLDKDLVHEYGRPVRRYILTEEGWEVAGRIKETGTGSTSLTHAATNTIDGAHLRRIVSAVSCSAVGVGQLGVAGLDQASLEDEVHQRSSTKSQTYVNEDDHDMPPPLDALPAFQPIVLPPGSFSVHLVLDSREVRTVKDRDYISEELQRKGITATTRGLPLGDALWVARPKKEYEQLLATANVEDIEEGSNEIVLDHIVERKRLDDLIYSIKDGRFHEQKFRLRRSGISKVTYIIESFSIAAEKGDKCGDAVASAIANTQVVNDYFVKETGRLDDTISYLAKMTNMLQEVYDQRSLFVIPTRVLHPRTYIQLQSKLRDEQPEQGYYVTFSAFSSLCSKSDTMSLRDVFLKMLMCTRGVTGEKALEIQKIWRTPIAFYEAMENLHGKARERMVADGMSTVVPRKRVTAGLSAKIAESWS